MKIMRSLNKHLSLLRRRQRRSRKTTRTLMGSSMSRIHPLLLRKQFRPTKTRDHARWISILVSFRTMFRTDGGFGPSTPLFLGMPEVSSIVVGSLSSVLITLVRRICG